MKVLVVGTGGTLVGSGITTSTDQTAEALRVLGHDVVRVVSGSRLRRRPNRLNLENAVAAVTESLEIARAVRQHRPEVVWLHTFGVPTLPALRTLAQVAGARLFCRSVVVRFQAFALEDHITRAGRTLRVAVRAISLLSTRLVAEHDEAARALQRVARAERVVTLPNWVEVPDRPAPLPDHPPYRAVFVGGLIIRKGVPQLIEAVRALVDLPVVLTIVGGPGDEGPAVAAAIERAGEDLVRRGRLRFAGQLDAAGVRAELRAAHVLVLPSEAEGMPLAMLEAMAEGRPVVVSDAGNMASVVREAACGLVLPSASVSDIAAALRSVVSDPAQLGLRGERAHQLASDLYSVGAATEGLRAILLRFDQDDHDRPSARRPARRRTCWARRPQDRARPRRRTGGDTGR